MLIVATAYPEYCISPVYKRKLNSRCYSARTTIQAPAGGENFKAWNHDSKNDMSTESWAFENVVSSSPSGELVMEAELHEFPFKEG